MERETKQLKLSFCEITCFSYLTWGEKEQLQTIIINGATGINQTGATGFKGEVLTEQKTKTLEILIKEIKQGDKTFTFTKEWFNNLRSEDGDELIDELNKVLEVKKK